MPVALPDQVSASPASTSVAVNWPDAVVAGAVGVSPMLASVTAPDAAAVLDVMTGASLVPRIVMVTTWSTVAMPSET